MSFVQPNQLIFSGECQKNTLIYYQNPRDACKSSTHTFIQFIKAHCLILLSEWYYIKWLVKVILMMIYSLYLGSIGNCVLNRNSRCYCCTRRKKSPLSFHLLFPTCSFSFIFWKIVNVHVIIDTYIFISHNENFRKTKTQEVRGKI